MLVRVRLLGCFHSVNHVKFNAAWQKWKSATLFFSVLQLEIKSWLVTGDSLSMELLKTEKGNTTVAQGDLEELQNTSASHHKTVRPPQPERHHVNPHRKLEWAEQASVWCNQSSEILRHEFHFNFCGCSLWGWEFLVRHMNEVTTSVFNCENLNLKIVTAYKYLCSCFVLFFEKKHESHMKRLINNK